ncbi:hypothetical protein BDW42DRAFT_168975 [Aspergillus taichungensis]|uniref:Uncharacterized protein n=1 Tax=Aspergillus taichungensis TaxID=482145 RepID=A0A2J5HVH0_9EURO|nr:hypothetical protein BDW42DRAFT_168975 [Aspergillus taichungensis]
MSYSPDNTSRDTKIPSPFLIPHPLNPIRPSTPQNCSFHPVDPLSPQISGTPDATRTRMVPTPAHQSISNRMTG